MNKALFSHKSDLWTTPKLIYEAYMAYGWFDPCPVNPKRDGLKIEWATKNFVNPPYSQISKWVDKAIEEAEKGKVTHLLVPARTDTKWFKKLFDYGCGFAFRTGRLKFGNSKNSAPFPSVTVVIDKEIVYSYIDVF